MTPEIAQAINKSIREESLASLLYDVRHRLDHRLKAMSIYLEFPTPERLVEVRELVAECQHWLKKITVKDHL